MKSRMFVVAAALFAMLVVGLTTAGISAAPNLKWALVNLTEPTMIAGKLVSGPVMFVHDDAKMVRGEPCTGVFRFTPGKGAGEELVAFHCKPRLTKAPDVFKAAITNSVYGPRVLTGTNSPETKKRTLCRRRRINHAKGDSPRGQSPGSVPGQVAMHWALSFVITVHGLIHLMGVAKAFGYAELSQLTQPISRGIGVMWLLAALLMVATAVFMTTWPRGFLIVGAVALVLSQVAIATAWRDAWAGSVANLILLVALAHAWLTPGR